jgi:hypothetical protein
MSRGDVDLEALEIAIRSLALGKAAQGIGAFMTAVGLALPTTPVVCLRCRTRMRGTGPKTKQILTLLGKTAYTRSRYCCPECGEVRYPGDEVLDLETTSRSPGVRRQVARLGAKEPFHEVAEDLRELAGLHLSRKDAERIAEGIGEDLEARDFGERERTRFTPPPPIGTPKTIDTLYIEMDGTGVPMVPWELHGRKGKQCDGSAKTREAKLGCIFTQTARDAQGRPMRDPATTTFTGAIEDAAVFGRRIYADAVRRGLFKAQRIVVLADGAEWIKNLVDNHFPMAIRIIDFYHAKEHVASLCKALFTEPKSVLQYREQWWEHLAEGKIEAIIAEAEAFMTPGRDPGKDISREIEYLRKNQEQMRYRQYRNDGCFIGSGVIEAGCKHVIGKRLKQSGMEWTVRGANTIIALRCATRSTRFTDYWDNRAA